jgi:hypothetical protein
MSALADVIGRIVRPDQAAPRSRRHSKPSGAISAAGLDVRGDAAVLLPPLYIGLVASEFEQLSEAGERAVAWALGLSEDSPLIPVTDVLLAAPPRGLDPETTLGHLFGVPAFTEYRADRPGVRPGLLAGRHPRRQGDPRSMARPARALRVAAAAVPDAPASPGPAEAAAAMDRLHATAIHTLREHVSDHGTCARCGFPWPCERAYLAESALGAG